MFSTLTTEDARVYIPGFRGWYKHPKLCHDLQSRVSKSWVCHTRLAHTMPAAVIRIACIRISQMFIDLKDRHLLLIYL